MNRIGYIFLLLLMLLSFRYSYAAFPITTTTALSQDNKVAASSFERKVTPAPVVPMKQWLHAHFRSAGSRWGGGSALSIVSGSFTACSIILVALCFAPIGAAVFLLYLFALLCAIIGFATGLSALLNHCSLRGLAIFGMAFLPAMIFALIIITHL
ncbi:hypothetical protein [Flavipsychrobacter stenotrophus]|uniref:hypothetical protein n=1 Tax=Flavipsychrobacter stenotrophus TaxID=2077091 RepID=UPI0010570300|nr:hypothetical protein [Flavipsychrobacter stenotrophus]